MIRPATLAWTLAVSLGCSAAAQAEVTHHFSGRFGVSYTSGQNGAPGTSRPLYEGSYTARFSHQSDIGVRFRFDLGLTASNFESPRPADWPPQDESD